MPIVCATTSPYGPTGAATEGRVSPEKARFLGASFHPDMANLLRKAAGLNDYDRVMPASSIVVQGAMDRALKQAADAGLGIFGMKSARPLHRLIRNEPVPT